MNASRRETLAVVYRCSLLANTLACTVRIKCLYRL